jgi:hypothetical protein
MPRAVAGPVFVATAKRMAEGRLDTVNHAQRAGRDRGERAETATRCVFRRSRSRAPRNGTSSLLRWTRVRAEHPVTPLSGCEHDDLEQANHTGAASDDAVRLES